MLCYSIRFIISKVVLPIHTPTSSGRAPTAPYPYQCLMLSHIYFCQFSLYKMVSCGFIKTLIDPSHPPAFSRAKCIVTLGPLEVFKRQIKCIHLRLPGND